MADCNSQWIFGGTYIQKLPSFCGQNLDISLKGGFEFGSPVTYDGGLIVSRSQDLGSPVVYVSMNYRYESC
jgi:hypothetical protein